MQTNMVITRNTYLPKSVSISGKIETEESQERHEKSSVDKR
jgi:hypothetical protein